MNAKKAKAAPAPQKSENAGKGFVTENQMLILQLLSHGADLGEVAKRFDLSVEIVAERVNATIANLQASAAAHARNRQF